MVATALIVDDERLFREGISTMITNLDLGWQVCGMAANGKDALQLFESMQPDLVITDIRMPVMDGLMLTEKLRSLCDRTQIVYLTGYKDFEYAQIAIQHHVSDYLLKPCSVDQLTSVLTKARYSLMKHNRLERTQTVTKTALTGEIPDDIEDGNHVQKAIDFIKENYASTCTLSLAAEALYLSSGYLGKLFKSDIGIPFSQYVIQYRMEKAMHLLQHTNIKIYRIAALVGIDDSNYFATTFKRFYGIAPSEVRK